MINLQSEELKLHAVFRRRKRETKRYFVKILSICRQRQEFRYLACCSTGKKRIQATDLDVQPLQGWEEFPVLPPVLPVVIHIQALRAC
jgi:hypothetical protein